MKIEIYIIFETFRTEKLALYFVFIGIVLFWFIRWQPHIPL